MKNVIGNITENSEDNIYSIFRIVIGLLFAQHGAQKIFGLFTQDAPVALMSQMGAAGIIELAGGLLIAIGLLTRITALISGLEMAVAYVMAHAPSGTIPIQNGGELALVYLVAFLLILVKGAGKASLEKLMLNKELF